MTKYVWIAAVILAIGCKSESSPPAPSQAPTPAPIPAPTPAPKPPSVGVAVEERAATAIKNYFEILAAFTTAFNAGDECEDKRKRVTAMFADATAKRDDVVALFRDPEVVKRAGPTMVRPSEDDPNYDVRMHAFGPFVEGTRASCDLEGDFNTFLAPIWSAATDAGWEYDDKQREKEILENKK
jgi:hypothetical protein